MEKTSFTLEEVDVQSGELFDDNPDVMFDTQIVLPDGRGVFHYQNEVYLFNGEVFEKYDPVMNLLWEDKIKRIRAVVESKSYAMIEGVLVDLYTASVIIKIYDSINLKNKLKFLSYSIPVMADIAFRAIRK